MKKQAWTVVSVVVVLVLVLRSAPIGAPAQKPEPVQLQEIEPTGSPIWENFLANPGFEEGEAHWQADGDGYVIIYVGGGWEAEAMAGQGLARLGGTNSVDQTLVSDPINLEGHINTQVKLCLWVTTDEQTTTNVYDLWGAYLDSSGTWEGIFEEGSNLNTTSGYECSWWDASPWDGVTEFQLRFELSNDNSYPTTFRLDELVVRAQRDWRPELDPIPPDVLEGYVRFGWTHKQGLDQYEPVVFRIYANYGANRVKLGEVILLARDFELEFPLESSEGASWKYEASLEVYDQETFWEPFTVHALPPANAPQILCLSGVNTLGGDPPLQLGPGPEGQSAYCGDTPCAVVVEDFCTVVLGDATGWAMVPYVVSKSGIRPGPAPTPPGGSRIYLPLVEKNFTPGGEQPLGPITDMVVLWIEAAELLNRGAIWEDPETVVLRSFDPDTPNLPEGVPSPNELVFDQYQAQLAFANEFSLDEVWDLWSDEHDLDNFIEETGGEVTIPRGESFALWDEYWGIPIQGRATPRKTQARITQVKMYGLSIWIQVQFLEPYVDVFMGEYRWKRIRDEYWKYDYVWYPVFEHKDKRLRRDEFRLEPVPVGLRYAVYVGAGVATIIILLLPTPEDPVLIPLIWRLATAGGGGGQPRRVGVE